MNGARRVRPTPTPFAASRTRYSISPTDTLPEHAVTTVRQVHGWPPPRTTQQAAAHPPGLPVPASPSRKLRFIHFTAHCYPPGPLPHHQAQQLIRFSMRMRPQLAPAYASRITGPLVRSPAPVHLPSHLPYLPAADLSDARGPPNKRCREGSTTKGSRSGMAVVVVRGASLVVGKHQSGLQRSPPTFGVAVAPCLHDGCDTSDGPSPAAAGCWTVC